MLPFLIVDAGGSGLQSLALALRLNDPNSICLVLCPDSRFAPRAPPPIASPSNHKYVSSYQRSGPPSDPQKPGAHRVRVCLVLFGHNQGNAISMSDSRVTL